jgi:hypothetical protein
MSTKALKIKRVFVWAIYSNLRSVAPKDYPSTAEIKSTINEILPALKEEVTFYVELLKRAEDLQFKIAAKEVEAAATQPEIDKINEEWRAYSREHGVEMVSVALSDEALKTLSDQFNREGWGKRWVVTIEEFGELSQAFDEAKK